MSALERLLGKYEEGIRESYEELLKVLKDIDRTLREILKELKKQR